MDKRGETGSRIREARKAAGLSQEGLARRADVSLNGLRQLEQGVRKDPQYSTLSKIARALDLTVNELMGEPLDSVLEDEGTPSHLHRPLDVKNMSYEELVKARVDLIEERQRLRPATKYRTKEEFFSPRAARVRDAYIMVLENFFAVRDALDEAEAGQRVAGDADDQGL